MTVRYAEKRDVPALVHLINTAYEAERFFVTGDRTNAKEIDRLLTEGAFTVAVGASDVLIGCGHVEMRGDRAYFGMLSVRPDLQGQGIGRALVAAIEADARAAGAGHMDIAVVNLREDLLRFYARLGYAGTGTAPYVHRPVLQPCHFVRMTKPLGGRRIDAV
jgi:N-acetylglutamate synthase-like GNAT family acetyltransferase